MKELKFLLVNGEHTQILYLELFILCSSWAHTCPLESSGTERAMMDEPSALHSWPSTPVKSIAYVTTFVCERWVQSAFDQGKGFRGGYEGEIYKRSQPRKPLEVVANGYTASPPTSGIKDQPALVPSFHEQGRRNNTGTYIMALRQGTPLMKAITFGVPRFVEVWWPERLTRNNDKVDDTNHCATARV